jgi:hypothetical protein
MLADRIFIGPKTPGQILVDQEHGLSFGVFVSAKCPAFQDRNPHRLEIVSTDDGPLDID